MISEGIKIRWDHSDEYVEIDLDDLHRVGQIESTVEWWKETREWVKYNTYSQAKRLRDGSIEVVITYDSARNTHLNPNDICFGKATVFIAPNQKSGYARWDDNDGPEDSGRAKWEVVETPVVGERKREPASRIQRRQEEFRAALVAIDEECALSGERTSVALEAAHIIPAKDGGSEAIGNGILLRADLHRLFDAGLFSIGIKGNVVPKASLAQSYRSLLKGKRLPEHTLKRVKSALQYLGTRSERV